MPADLNADEVAALVQGHHAHPFSILGPHTVWRRKREARVIRAFLPGAREGEVRFGTSPHISTALLKPLHPGGLFEAVAPPQANHSYVVSYIDRHGHNHQRIDPYRFQDLLSDYDLYLLAEGTHLKAYEKMGAHAEIREGVQGVRFAVWAPNAQGVSLLGDFNEWDTHSHPLDVHEGSGIWQLFVPGLRPGALYKYLVRFQNGSAEQKIDPFGFGFETPPRTATCVYDLSSYRWSDQQWMEQREQRQTPASPVAVYEVHAGSWKRVPEQGRRSLNYRELAEQLVPYVKELGFTHIELLPVTEHPLSASWGYQTSGYFAPTSRFGDPDDFRFFVDTCHRHEMGVILDWVPAHFPQDRHALACFDGTHLYEHADPRQGAHPDWGTLIFNYGRREVAAFLLSSALFWLDQYHIDGLRVDAVASMLYLDYSRKPGEWIPNRWGGNEHLEAIDFLKRFNQVVHERFPGVLTMAEESTAWAGVSRPTYAGGLGFSLKWNMGWMNDSLAYMGRDPVHRKYHHHNLTFSLIYAFSENFVLPLSHDEVVHGKGALLSKMPGDLWQKYANLRLFYGYMYGHPGKKLLFMGGEFGAWEEWNFDTSLDWHLLQWESHRKLQAYVQELNHLYVSEPALHEVDFDSRGFEWIDFHDAEGSIISFLRRARQAEDFLVFLCNFTPVPRYHYRIGVPYGGFYEEILNSDSEAYGGSNLGNLGGLQAEPIGWQGRPYSLLLTVPPLATLILRVKKGPN